MLVMTSPEAVLVAPIEDNDLPIDRREMPSLKKSAGFSESFRTTLAGAASVTRSKRGNETKRA